MKWGMLSLIVVLARYGQCTSTQQRGDLFGERVDTGR